MNLLRKKSGIKQDERSFCPYCSSAFASAKIMSKHIDDIHIGRGLMEGNMKNW